MKKNKMKYLKSLILIVFLSFFMVMPRLSTTVASGTTYEISNVEELLYASQLSKTEGHQNDTFILRHDITITENDQSMIEASADKAIIFGSSSLPFSGTFEGNGYTISNLKYSNDLTTTYDSGLFSSTDGATIRNLTIDNAEINVAYRGGIIVGRADNTVISNVTVKNSSLVVSAADNILTLITDGGVRAGVIAGELFNSVVYNVESENNIIINDNTSAVQALAGKGITLGNLVGISDNSLIEYSRVYGGKASASYDVAVGAVGGNTIYVGGIAGRMRNGSKIIDSFSTSELYYYCATYVSVGAGNAGHIGGITAEMSGDDNEIIRSHYAGVATSRQYNAVLVIPIIQNNVNVSGLVDVFDGGSVVNSYFKPSANPDVTMNVLGNSTSTSSYGPLTDDKYESKEFWQEVNYDFVGNIRRSSEYSSNHNNKWVMNTDLGIPVHGNSVSATFDFPNAGEVIIKPTNLMNHNVSTKDAYYFAVQGIGTNEKTISIEAKENTGYKFISWYKVPDVNAWSVDNHDYYDTIFNTVESVSNNKVYNNISVSDNDLFLARYQAKVLFHDVNGNTIDTSGNASNNTDNDYYDYNSLLPSVIPSNKPASETAKLIGWTTVKSQTGGYSSISQPELEQIKNSNEFYEPGDKITKTMELYPVYVDLTSNIRLVFEGNEQDSSSNESIREGVGALTLEQDNNGDITLKVIGSNLLNLPDGYRFLGWYNSSDIRVSKDLSYKLSDDIDLTIPQTFTAKFEYRVNYYTRAYAQDGKFADSSLYKETWVRYNTDFVNLPAPGYLREYITHWGVQHVNHSNNNNELDAFNGKIVEPINVYSHNYTTASNGSSGYQLSADVDFKGSGIVSDDTRNAGAILRFTPVSDRYNFLFWTFQRSGNAWTYKNNPMDTGVINSLSNYMARAFVTADIVFHKKNDTDTVVKRKYLDNVFATEYTHTYKYPFYNSNSDISTSTQDSQTIDKTYTFESSPTKQEMDISGYAFLGWITDNDIEVNSSEWDYIYDVNDLFCSSNIHKVQPYLVDESSLIVEKYMDLYPVYAKYNIITKTNVSGVDDPTINVPANPSYNFVETSTGVGVVTITPELNTKVKDGEDVEYSLSSITVSKNGSEPETITPDNEGVYKYVIEAGIEYTFQANYEPYIIVYHLNDTDTVAEIKNEGENLGVIPDPTYDITSLGSNIIFAGYSDTRPVNGYHLYANLTEFNNANINIVEPANLVTKSLELWPVYIGAGVNINSNIDTILENDNVDFNTIYSLDRASINTMSININEEDYGLYHFIGWYKDYVDDNNYGTLLSTNKNYILNSTEALSSDNITAVYKRAYQINYYGIDNNIFETVYVRGDINRSFVNIELDNDNNEIETVIDADTIVRFLESLDNNLILSGYNWVKQDGTYVYWDDFKNNNITEDMNLYPVVKKLTAYNSNNEELTTNIITYNNSGEDINATINTLYKDNTLKIHADLIKYHLDNNIVSNINDLNINLFSNSELEQYDYTKKTNGSGDAIFKLYKDITIKNKYSNKESDIAIYKVTDVNTSNTISLALKGSESLKVKLPYGDYTITSESNWNWRYSPYNNNLVISNLSSDKLDIENTIIKHKWFSSADISRNIFE